jgi:hypothetical protein
MFFPHNNARKSPAEPMWLNETASKDN